MPPKAQIWDQQIPLSLLERIFGKRRAAKLRRVRLDVLSRLARNVVNDAVYVYGSDFRNVSTKRIPVRKDHLSALQTYFKINE